MFWKKKQRKKRLNTLELKILDFLVDKIDTQYKGLLKKQLEFLGYVIRENYKTYVITELYPIKFDITPEEFLFGRKEEFHLAIIKFNLNNENYTCDVHAVLGSIFDLKISPTPSKKTNMEEVVFKRIKITPELDKDVGKPYLFE